MTQLPEPHFIDRNPETITQEWIKLYEEKSGKILYPAQIERLMIDLGAYRESVLRNKIQEVAKKNLLSYAPLDVLEHIGEPLGVSKLSAKYATTVLKFLLEKPLEFDYIIEKGTEVETQDDLFIFKTTESAKIKAGELFVEVNAICQTNGIGGNSYKVGTITNLLTPLKYVSAVENITVSSGGADDEDAESLRNRIRVSPEKFSNAGSKGAYYFHTLTAHQAIIDVSITSPAPGVVAVYPLTIDGNPTDEIINLVQEYLNNDKIRPLTDYVQVLKPENIDFSIKAKLYLYKDADIVSVKKTIDSKILEYKNLLASKLGKNVVQTQIITLLNSVYGVFKVELETPFDIEIKENQWANLLDFEIVFGGYADE